MVLGLLCMIPISPNHPRRFVSCFRVPEATREQDADSEAQRINWQHSRHEKMAHRNTLVAFLPIHEIRRRRLLIGGLNQQQAG